MKPEERRKSPRVAVDMPLRLTVGGKTVAGRFHDLCRDAALVETHEPCAVGDKLTLSWDSAGGGEAEVAGVVLRISTGEGDARAVAILFVDVAPATATAIELLLARAGLDG